MVPPSTVNSLSIMVLWGVGTFVHFFCLLESHMTQSISRSRARRYWEAQCSSLLADRASGVSHVLKGPLRCPRYLHVMRDSKVRRQVKDTRGMERKQISS